MGMITPPLKIKIMLESNPLKSRILVRRLAGCSPDAGEVAAATRAKPAAI